MLFFDVLVLFSVGSATKTVPYGTPLVSFAKVKKKTDRRCFFLL